jgi:crotonobetainyl-CoA:carnitine CoA-transferase CaiB-like acyl-CoA transferase
LADLGAEVVKVESPHGDPARSLLPGVFKTLNRNKRGVMLDLKDPASASRVGSLMRWADVVVESFRPGVAARIGIGVEVARHHNPKIIYCSMSGFGQDGPWRAKPGHDLTYSAAAGAMSHSGSWGQAPSRSGLPVGDFVAGMMASNAILAALRERDLTGQSAQLDLSIFESMFFCAATRHGLDESEDITRHLFPGNDLYQTADGETLALGLMEDHYWQVFCDRAAALDAGISALRSLNEHARRARGDEVTAKLKSLVRAHTLEQWCQRLEGSDIPFEVCVTPSQAARSDHLRVRGRVAQQSDQQFVPFPVTVDGKRRPGISRASPRIGQETEDFFNEIQSAQS